MSSAIFLIVMVVALAVLYLLLVNGTINIGGVLRIRKPKQPALTPQQELQNAIDQRVLALQKAQEALTASEVVVRQAEREVKQSEADVKTLNAKIETALGANNEGDARKAIGRLQKEEEELAIKREGLEAAFKTHQFYAATVQTEREAIEEAKREADRLSVRLQLAKADTAYRATADVAEKAADLKQAADVAEIDVKAARPVEDEFDKASKEAEVDARLAAFKERMKG